MLSEYKEDLEKQSAGSPIYLGDYTFHLRRWGTPESIRVRKSIHRRLFGPLHEFTEEDDSLLIAYWLLEYGVSDWAGIIDDNGEDVPYSQSAAESVFLNESYWLSLNVELFNAANKWENYLLDQIEEVVEAIKKP